MSRLRWGLVLLTAFALAQDAPPVFRATTELVLVDVQVVHKKTKSATGSLQQKDFQIYEDGALREIKSFSRDQLPLSLVLLFDLTDSSRPVLKDLAMGAKAALAHLKPDDEVAVMEYAAAARLVEGFTTDRLKTVEAIERAAKNESDEACLFQRGGLPSLADLAPIGQPRQPPGDHLAD